MQFLRPKTSDKLSVNIDHVSFLYIIADLCFRISFFINLIHLLNDIKNKSCFNTLRRKFIFDKIQWQFTFEVTGDHRAITISRQKGQI